MIIFVFFDFLIIKLFLFSIIFPKNEAQWKISFVISLRFQRNSVILQSNYTYLIF